MSESKSGIVIEVKTPEKNIEDKKEQTAPETKDSTKSKNEENKLLGKKQKREEGKKINRELCSICRDGGSLLLCDNCPRSFHLECLKLKEENIPEGKWYCPICAPKMDKKNEKMQKDSKLHEDSEKERKRLIKNEKRRLWRLKRKEKLEAMMNNANNKLTTKDGNMLIDSFIKKDASKGNGYINTYQDTLNKMEKLPLINSKMCLNISYTTLVNEEHLNKNISFPLLFPIPNNILIDNDKKINTIKDFLKTKNSLNNLITNYYKKNEKVVESILLNEKENEKENSEQKNIKNIIEYNIKDNLENFNKEDELKKIISTPNSINALNTIIKNNNNSINKYNIVVREYWDYIFQKKSSINNKHIIKYPIEDKEIYSFPDLHNIEQKYYEKPEGNIYPNINGSLFSRLINIYDFLSTFSSKIYLSPFSFDEFYSALKYSENYTENEITLLSSIHVSLLYILFKELSDMKLLDIYNNNDIEIQLLKIIIDYLNEPKLLYVFLYQTWPELVRLVFFSYTFNKTTYMLADNRIDLIKKLTNVKNIISYNTELAFDEKIKILERLVSICYETNFVREAVKEAQEKKKEIKKTEKEYEEELKEIEQRKRELERQEQFTQPQLKIDEINKRLSTLSEDNSTLTRQELSKLRKKIETEREEFKSVLKEINKVNNERDEVLSKIDKQRNEINDLPAVGKKCIGNDGRGYKYFYLPWMSDILFIRISKKNSDEKYEWRYMKDEETIKDLIDKLSDKGIHESALKHKLKRLFPKKFSKTKNNNVIKSENNTPSKDHIVNLENIFNNNVLKYENLKNPLKNTRFSKYLIINNNSSQYDFICEKLCKLEDSITNYLAQDSKQWESYQNRMNIRGWITCNTDIKQFVNLLLLLNEKVKNPYKIEEQNNNIGIALKNHKNKKIIEEDDNEIVQVYDENCPINNKGEINPNFNNIKLQLSGKARLWSKDYESYNLEDIYLEYLNNATTIPTIYICITIFEVILSDLNKRREIYKKKNDDFIYEVNGIANNTRNNDKGKTDLKVNYEDDSYLDESYEENNNKRKVIKKKKKTIDWNEKCMYCGDYGDLLCCEDCPNVAHLSCTTLKTIPEIWRCDDCLYKLSNRRMTRSSYNKYNK